MILKEGKMRVDKWLWCVRIFKSRSIAADACRSNKVSMDDKPIKASHQIGIGDVIGVKKEGYHLIFQVSALLKSRVGAPIAQECYINLTSPDELAKFDEWYIGKARSEFREKGLGRPTKKERRQIDDLKQKQ
jgi:ribosome-associated heat shock protein Hsp15